MNLVKTSALVRKLINIFIGLVVLYILALITSPALKDVYYSLFPPKDLPNIFFGQLEPLEFTEKPLANTKPTYSLDTPNGKLPGEFPNKMVVYQYRRPRFLYEAGRDAQKHAAFLGFTDDELITDLKGTTYRWRDKTSGGVLEINTISQEISLTTALAGKSIYFSPGSINRDNAANIAKQMYKSIDRFYDQLYTQGHQTVELGKIQNTQIVATQFSHEAEIARVDFFRKVSEYPIFGPDPKKGLMSVILKTPSNSDSAFNYPVIDYHEWELIPTIDGPRATYPIITVEQAWNAVAKENKGVVVSVMPIGSSVFSTYVPTRVDQILINNIYLAYYDTPQLQQYMQPIYVFEGKYNVSNRPGGEIVIYFPAVQGQHIKSVTPATPSTN